ncbi:bifunctional methylenetetrahydrofolate dehydrogenase/methenyltetrahydrofolate cyclohydrolase FolD [Glacieibacterium sp.]|uniref:bifunctional methylenetetrahydrofolate dehydrogenase/methenyltetrahydrofolate cyclohydrolase FolD n=1 Tax=Glacieibacterium sp. TaxID=2860237 RepID=UPI003B00BC55
MAAGVGAAIIDGKAFAAGLRARVGAAVPAFQAATGRVPGLAVVLVGEDPASHVYVRNKGIATREAGMASFEHRLPADVSEDELLALVAALNGDDGVDGILVQMPCPRHISEARVIAAVDPDKDVDGFHPVNAGRLASGLPGLVPCTPSGCLMLLQDRLGDLSGLEALVIGRSNIVGKPMAALLVAASATVTVAHSRTRDLAAHVGRADIVVAAVGVPELVRGAWLKPGATVIDVGMNRIALPDGKTRLVGDVAFAEALEVAGAITPVPGGVGPMTIACLLRNTLIAAHARAGLAVPSL